MNLAGSVFQHSFQGTNILVHARSNDALRFTLSESFFSCSSGYRLLASCQILNPSFSIPSPNTLSTATLDGLFGNVDEQNKSMYENGDDISTGFHRGKDPTEKN